ncbi:MAG TPA: 4'-phosphopantetheinyl transferase superfamily protein [Lacunisphaera sp.]|nr:4'-phosphopantetheinyl transferase superfamily protein [Lacunisphaera sp.]
MIEDERINWRIPERFPALHAREIHLWCARFGPEDGAAPEDRASLSPDEVARADAFHFAIHRHRFIAARRNLRQVLGAYTGHDPARLAFHYGRFGKPLLAHQAITTDQLGPAVSDLMFNQSHCGALWLLAVAWHQPLGLDVEQVREMSDLFLLESRIFTAEELLVQRSLPHPERRLAFFRRWTEREAATKFHGLGFDPAKPCVPPDRCERLSPTSHSVAALAYGGPGARLGQFQWSPGLLATQRPETAEVAIH